ncbi:type IV secretion system protein [Sphingobium sp. YR768]|uniref:type IV secretion system protein n=1 Tax=Sphingobium sp. YR768 TaxID=1884365 RepID=UPI0008B6D938|nr:type IV secretion system protein [Sphingobium sp. YR768]SES13787.1 type IV secretion system protein VirB6 [Sphingobium sp. YR768]
MEGCPPFDASQGYAMALTHYVDCQAALLGEGGYGALAANNSPVVMALGGLLTILIAIQGYRLLLGDQLHIRDGIMLAARVGLVLAFATQWSAYRAVVYNLVIETPREIVSILPGAGGGPGRSFPARLQGSYQTIAELTRPSHDAPPAPAANPAAAQNGAAPASASAMPEPMAFSLAGNPLLSAAGIVLLVSGLAVLLSVRLLAGLLLALGPLFFVCLLFDTTRGLFEGWVRALLGIAIASITTSVLLGIEMSIVEPQLGHLIDAMAVGTLPVMAPGEILATALIFLIALLVALRLSLKVGAGFRFLDHGRAIGTRLSEHWQPSRPSQPREQDGRLVAIAAQEEGRSRAALISDAIAISDRWKARPLLAGDGPAAARRMALADGQAPEPPPTPLGQTYRRTGAQRRTKSLSQRNGRT